MSGGPISSGTAWLAQQLLGAAAKAPPAIHAGCVNPRPPGVIRPGSATEAVLALLRENPRRQFMCITIVQRTGCTRAAVDWALLYLRSQNLINTHQDAERNPRYLRYSLAKASRGDT